MEMCEENEVCEPKSKMECKTEYEEICTEEQKELCEAVKVCKTVYKNVCDGGVCSPQLLDECYESGITEQSNNNIIISPHIQMRRYVRQD